MADDPASDDALLARLNALKKSSISFNTSPSSSVVSPSPKPIPHDDLAARFARLGSASPSSSPKPSRTTSSADVGAPVIAPGAPSYLEGIAEGVGRGETEANVEDERSLEELLAELGPRQDWDMQREDEKDVGKMLRDIRAVLPEVQKSRQEGQTQQGKGEKEDLTDWENIEVDIGSAGVNIGRGEQRKDDDGSEEGDTEKKPTEDDEADDIIARVMAELEISKKYDPPSPPPEDDKDSDSGDQRDGEQKQKPEASGAGQGELSLPSVPTSLPQDDFDRTQAIEDALTARLAALTSSSRTDPLGLPSAPSFSPTKKPPKIQSNLAKKLDEEIETWCIICNEDATLRCLGCDGDLYCRKCWMEGHRGESAGFEERRHRAVEFVKDGKKKKAVAV